VTAEDLIERARSATGLDDLGSEHFRDFLDAWCADLEAPRLSDAGRTRLANLAVRNLENRLRIEDTLKRHPEIGDVPVPPIVRIAGFARSGTTLLHQLLTLNPQRRALLRWELVEPVPPPEASSYRTDPRIEKVAKPLAVLRGTELERMHWVEATDPEECTWGFYDLTGLLGRGCMLAAPQWGDQLLFADHDHRQTYVEYRRLIQLLLWHNPVPPGGTLVLKSPTDTDALPAFLDVFPEAAVVLLHRDPFRTLTSGFHIQRVINTAYLVDGKAVSDEEYVASGIAVHTRFADAMVDLAAARPGQVTSVRYADLMDDPVAVVADVERRVLGPDSADQDTERRVNEFLDRQRSGTRAAPPAGYETFGLSADAVHDQPSLARYMGTFEIPAERQRVTAPQP
jgi:hypothetical protein